jgi:hypothetical protein
MVGLHMKIFSCQGEVESQILSDIKTIFCLGDVEIIFTVSPISGIAAVDYGVLPIDALGFF